VSISFTRMSSLLAAATPLAVAGVALAPTVAHADPTPPCYGSQLQRQGPVVAAARRYRNSEERSIVTPRCAIGAAALLGAITAVVPAVGAAATVAAAAPATPSQCLKS
jgi:hypothetical protein